MSQENTDTANKKLEQDAEIMHKLGIGRIVLIGDPFLIFGLILLSVGISGRSA